jgi:hypothetical protein
MGEGQGGGGQNKFGFPLPLIPSTRGGEVSVGYFIKMLEKNSQSLICKNLRLVRDFARKRRPLWGSSFLVIPAEAGIQGSR